MKNGSLLWSIEDVPSRKVSYLFGTMHVKDERAFRWIDQLTQLITDCDGYAAESHIDDLADTSHTQHFISKDTLSVLIPKKKYDRLRKSILKSFDIDIQQYDRMYPMILTNMLAEGLLYSSRSISLDASLWSIAKKHNKTLLGIESAEQQMEIFKRIPLDVQLKSLLKIGRNPSTFKKQVLKTVSQYEHQQTQKLYKSSKKSLGALRNLLLYSRNRLMSDTIADVSSQQSTFFAVGAAHLYGNKGILKYLKEKKKKLKPITLQVSL